MMCVSSDILGSERILVTSCWLPGTMKTSLSCWLPGATKTFPFLLASRSNEYLPFLLASRSNEDLPFLLASRSNEDLPFLLASRSNEDLPFLLASRNNEDLPFLEGLRCSGKPTGSWWLIMVVLLPRKVYPFIALYKTLLLVNVLCVFALLDCTVLCKY